MTVTLSQMLFYTGALVVLFVTPGPVWMAMIARGLSGGFSAAFPVALGVAIGDVVWPLTAILGVTWIVSQFADFMLVLRWVACLMFLGMGLLLLRNAGHRIGSDSRLTRPGRLAGFLAGMAVILGNPKAILFYMGVLPGFFDIGSLTWPDIAVICLASFAVPLTGNFIMALSVHRIRSLLTTPGALRRLNIGAGLMLICVGLVIPLL
ncbi:LysE family translocator [Frigidibacter sp. ROC022]|uniref:LysE family translocator n=1 Tax=Frigidibacter sp. ROC022 TaxID=2971796 RepID=UPI00215A2235|nr:LysE family translocator [Frigidibacter sp. ROC022]MCR8724389.1 LysE family translocator [Frigidibacter sp. ROC022]